MGPPEVGDGPRRQTRRREQRERESKIVLLIAEKRDAPEGEKEKHSPSVGRGGKGSEARKRSSERRDSVRILYTRSTVIRPTSYVRPRNRKRSPGASGKAAKTIGSDNAENPTNNSCIVFYYSSIRSF